MQQKQENKMTLKEFVETNWYRGNVVKFKNGKEYLVK